MFKKTEGRLTYHEKELLVFGYINTEFGRNSPKDVKKVCFQMYAVAISTRINLADEDSDSDLMERAPTATTLHRGSGDFGTHIPFTTQVSQPYIPQSSSTCSCCDCPLYNDHYKLWITLLWIIAILFSIAMMTLFSTRYGDRLQHPSEFHYTTCIISNIRDSDTITFVYGTNNNDWNQKGRYDIADINWNRKYKEGDIGTCLYSTKAPNFHDQFTINNYLMHSDSVAMWLIRDNKYGTINFIIFFVCCTVFLSALAYQWFVVKAMELVPLEEVCGSGFTACLLACVVVGWPVMIMGSIIQSELNGSLSDGISVWDVYESLDLSRHGSLQYDCRIDAIVDTIIYNAESGHNNTFALVKYDVFTNNGNLMAINIQYPANVNDTNSTETNATYSYFDVDSWHYCYQNKYTQQVILRPNSIIVEWLQPPKRNAIFGISIGCLLICSPCVIAACLGLSGGYW